MTEENKTLKWSEQHYPGLEDWQHEANNDWFQMMTRLVKPGGTIAVPNLGKCFNIHGEEIQG
tara:strand:- start:2135 stop:2320 length:186 start_codon:yes stop_codon:yes gene_type:complete